MGPYVILKRKIELFTRKILMYVLFPSDLPFFCYLVPKNFLGSYSNKRLFFKDLRDTQNSRKSRYGKNKSCRAWHYLSYACIQNLKKNEKNFFRKKKFFYQNDIEKK